MILGAFGNMGALNEPSQGATVDRAFVQLKLLDLPVEGSEPEVDSADEGVAGDMPAADAAAAEPSAAMDAATDSEDRVANEASE